MSCSCDIKQHEPLSEGSSAVDETLKSVSSTATVGEEEFRIHVVNAGSSHLDARVDGFPVKARVDSGAEVTIVSLSVYEQLERKPRKVRSINMQLAGKDSVMS